MWFEIMIANLPLSLRSVPGCEFLCVTMHVSEVHHIHSETPRHLVFTELLKPIAVHMHLGPKSLGPCWFYKNT